MTDVSTSHNTSEDGRLPIADVPHTPRRTDVSPKAAKRAERQVVAMFGLSVLLVIAFVVAYVAIPKDLLVYIPVLGNVGAMNVALGVCMGGAVFLIGAGAIQWAKKLMPDVEVVQERHTMESTPAETGAAAAQYERGKEESGFAKFPLIRRSLIGAMALFPIPLIVILRDLWTQPVGAASPAEELSRTIWKKGSRIVVDGTFMPVKAADVPVGGLISAVPEELHKKVSEGGVEEEVHMDLNELGKAAILVVRMKPEEIRAQQGNDWDYQGIVAYSKICTHVGCPIALYEQRTHHLLCPCHQSTFDLADAGNVVFGPAARRMPQLPIGVDDEGYLIAMADFAEPVGPSFWERG